MRGSVLKCSQAQEHNEDQIPLLEMRNMTLQAHMDFDRYIFKNMNFKVYSKQFVIIIGENGAGKSTGKSGDSTSSVMPIVLNRR